MPRQRTNLYGGDAFLDHHVRVPQCAALWQDDARRPVRETGGRGWRSRATALVRRVAGRPTAAEAPGDRDVERDERG